MSQLSRISRSKLRTLWYRYFRPLRVFIRRYIKRLHMLDIRSEMHGYNGGYSDPCEQVLYANFAILKNFIEKEKPFDFYDLEIREAKVVSKETGKPTEEEYYQEIWDLYVWWTVGRKREQIAIDLVSRKVNYSFVETANEDPHYGKLYEIKWEGPKDELRQMEREFEIKEDEMLMRLMKVRRHLWT